MSILAAAFQVVIALGIFNVWILRRDRGTPYRPDGANSIAEEFERYGLPPWVRVAVGVTKLSLASLLLVGLFYAEVAAPAAAVMAILMVGAIAAHLRVRDPLVRSAPAALMLLMSLFVAVTQSI